MIEVIFAGRPVPWARHRTGKGRHYTPAAQQKRLDDFALMIRAAAKGQKFSGPVILDVVFDYRNSGETTVRLRASSSPAHRAKRGDIDNLVKWVMESLQASGVVKDDAQVAFLIAEKVE